MSETTTPQRPARLEVSGKVTLYFRSPFVGVAKVEATRLEITMGKHAQYQAAVMASFTPKSTRRRRQIDPQYRDASLVVLEGWGHPDPDGIWDEASERKNGEVTTMRGRYSSCDPRWQSDFNVKLAAYTAAHHVKVLADYRGYTSDQR